MPKNYKAWTKERLIRHINDLEERIQKQDHDFLVEFPWAGNLGQWFWDYEVNTVTFNDKKVSQLGYDPIVVGDVGFEFFTNKLHPDDYEYVMENMRKHLRGESDAYEVEYRIRHKDGHYLWYYDRGTLRKRDKDGKPLYLQGIVFDITESKKVEEKFKVLSERDVLTNLYNRRMMFRHLENYIEEKMKNGKTFSLIMFDIDHFKNINDTYGHLVGDETLKRLSELVVEDKRSNDIVYRYGGEEFFILLPDTELVGAVKVAKRLHKLIANMHIPKVGHITVSMGVVESQINDTVDELIKRADVMMYKAKEQGRNLIKY